jgi:hypothetical protein
MVAGREIKFQNVEMHFLFFSLDQNDFKILAEH